LSARTYLGFDYGTRHIGVAVGGAHSGLAQPAATVSVRGASPDWEALDGLVRDWQPDALVIGLPLNMDGSETRLAPAARRFGNRLSSRYNLPVHLVDERLTSRAARELLGGASRQRVRKEINAIAAQQILQTFLDEHADNPRHSG
jgi:putative Holliday junction resolvase